MGAQLCTTFSGNPAWEPFQGIQHGSASNYAAASVLLSGLVAYGLSPAKPAPHPNPLPLPIPN